MIALDGNVETRKTYPKEVEKLRELWLAEIERIKAKYTPSPTSTATAIAAQIPQTPRELDRMRRAYQAEIDHIIKELAKLEGLAQLSWVIKG
jgi:aspartate/methionine/tyrosine aminotransferase